MTVKRNTLAEQTGPATSAGAWGLRYPGLVMSTGGKNEVKEFTGMWRLKPDADLVAFTDTLSREVPVWGGPGRTFSEATCWSMNRLAVPLRSYSRNSRIA